MKAFATALVILNGVVGQAHPQQQLAITSTTIIDGRTGRTTPDQTILIAGEHIVAVGPTDKVRVPSNARTIDGRGMWAAPGFVDVHAHSTPPAVLRRALALGVTAIHMMPSVPAPSDTFRAMEARSASSDVTPRLLVTSPLFTGRFPGNVLLRAVNFATPKSAAEAQQTVARLRREGFGAIKVIQDDGRLWTGSETVVPRLPGDVFRALIHTAHREGMRVYAHVTQLGDTRDAIDAGADVFVHGTMDSTLSDALWGRMRERRIVWAPAIRIVAAGADPAVYARRILGDRVLRETLSDVELSRLVADTSGSAQPPDMPFPALRPDGSVLIRILHENASRARALGVTVAVGSDAGVSGNGPGIGTHMEMELLQEAGLAPSDVIVAATYSGATAIGLQEKIGTIEPGKLADIVILTRNPLTDIRNARAIEWIVKGGQPIRRSAISSNSPRP